MSVPSRDVKAEVAAAKATANQRTARAVFWFAVPVVLAVGLTCYARWDRTRAALDLVDTVATDLHEPLERCREKSELDERAKCEEALIAAKVRQQLGEKPDPDEAERARSLLRTIANDLLSTKGEQCSFWMRDPFFPRCTRDATKIASTGFLQRVAYALWKEWISVALILLFITSALMGLFMIDVFRARRELLAVDGRRTGFDKHRDEIEFDRNRRVLDRRRYVLRRFGVMLMISTGASYLLAPIGLQSSVLGDYTVLHPILGHPSAPFWIEQMKHASAASVGFLGFLVYALMTLGRRAVSRDLSDRAFVSLLNRGLLVVMLSIVLGALTDGGAIWRAVIFFAGIFPQTGLDALGKYAQVKVASLTADESAGFEVLPEIDIHKQVTLRELGVNDANDLARTDLYSLVREVGIESAVILRAADRAVLVHYLGASAAKRLESIPIYTACELLEYADDQADRRAFVARAVSDEKNIAPGAFEVQLDEIAKDPNVQYLLSIRARYGSY